MKQQTGLIALITLALGGLIECAVAQPKDVAPVKYKFTTETPPGIASPQLRLSDAACGPGGFGLGVVRG